MRRGARWALLALAVPACLAAWLPRSGLLCSLANWGLDRALAGGTPLRVHLGSLSAQGFGVLRADDVVVLAPLRGAQLPLLTLDRLTFHFDLWPLLKGGLRAWPRVPRLARLEGLRVMILREPGGSWNLAALSAPGGVPGPRARSVFFPDLPFFRMELENSRVTFDDGVRGFHSTVDQVQGLVDSRGFPKVRFALSGRTSGHRSRNLALSGAWNAAADAGQARLDLRGVAMAGYLNYFLPVRGPHFTAGTASLDVRLGVRSGSPWTVSGRAALADGGLRLPGVRAPLSGLDGGMDFDARALRFQGVRARFLGSDWTAGGDITYFSALRADLTLSNPAVPLAVLTRQVVGLGALALSGTASVSATLRGALARPRVEARLAAPSLFVHGVRFDGLAAHALWYGRRLDVDRVRAELWGGQAEGSASLDFSGEGSLAADVSVTGALLQLGSLAGRPLPFRGLARAWASARGPLRSPRVELDLDVDKLRLGSLAFGGVRARGRFADGRGEGVLASGRGSLKGTLGWSASAERGPVLQGTGLVLSGLSLSDTVRSLGLLRPWLPCTPAQARFWTGLAGRLDGAWSASLTVQGPLGAPGWWAETRLENGRLGLAPGRSLAVDWKGALGFSGGALRFGRDGVPFAAQVGTRKGLHLAALGSYRLSGPARPGDALGLVWGADLGFLDAFGFARGDRGRLGAELTVTGRAATPLVQGALTVSKFSCRPVARLAPVRDGNLSVLFSGSVLRISRLDFDAPGRVSATGELDFGRGLGALRGRLTVSTDPTGLGLVRWPGLGSGDLALCPLRVVYGGVGRPLEISGRVVLSSAHITYAGAAAGEKAAADAAPSRLPPLDLDLRVGLGSNVWYERRQSKALDADPAHWFTETLDSASKSLLEPDLSLGFAPTHRDILVRGLVPEVDLEGELFVDRGWVTIMQDDFQLGGDQGPTRITLHGERADLSGTAAVNLSYTRMDPYTNRPIQKEVQALVYISSRNDPGDADQFLDLQLRFDSIPPIIQGDPALQQTAVLDLVLLGDPVVDIGGGNSGTLSGGGDLSVSGQQASDSGALLAGASLGAVTTGFARQELASLLDRFDIPGADWLDVVRLSPRIRYQMVGAVPLGAASPTAPVQPLSSQAQSSYDVDWSLELGKSIGEKLYTSLQAMTFGQDARDSVIVASESDQAVLSYALRGGLEYHLGPYRQLEAYEDFGCDDDLNPLAYPSRWAEPTPSYLLQWRATIPTDDYGTLLARRRRFDGPVASP